MRELTVLMSWHEETEPERIRAYEENKKSFSAHNPGVEVITVMSHFSDFEEAWLSTDLSIFHWYRKFGAAHPAARYLLVEWDCWCDCDLHEYFTRVWDCDVVGPCVKYPERDDWYWFSTINKLPDYARAYSTGIVPFCGLLLSDRAMKEICTEILKPEYKYLNSELRLPTIATMLNFDPVTNPVCSRTITWRDGISFDQRYKGLHHPRKKICIAE